MMGVDQALYMLQVAMFNVSLTSTWLEEVSKNMQAKPTLFQFLTEPGIQWGGVTRK